MLVNNALAGFGGYQPPVVAGGTPASLKLSAARAVLYKRMPASGTFNADQHTVSLWYKFTDTGQIIPFTGVGNVPTGSAAGSNRFALFFNIVTSGDLGVNNVSSGNVVLSEQDVGASSFNDGAWHHLVVQVDSLQATETDRCKIYKDGSILTDSIITTWSSNEDSLCFAVNQYHAIGAANSAVPAATMRIAFFDIIEGTTGGPTDFAFNNGGTWTRKPYPNSYGTHGWGWDGTNGFNSTAGVIEALTANVVVLGDLDTVDLPPWT